MEVTKYGELLWMVWDDYFLTFIKIYTKIDYTNGINC